jgi:hypothetical protein
MGCAQSGEVESWLDVDEKLEKGDWVFSPSKDFKFMLKEDGNLVMLHKDTDVWWESKTAGCGATHVTLKSDGDLVLLKDGSEVWSLGTGGCGGNTLWVEDNGFVGVYNGDTCKAGIYDEWLKTGEHIDKGDWIWSNNGEYKLTISDAGDLVLECYDGTIVWSANVSGATDLWMETDGTLTLYKGDDVIWSAGAGATEMWVEDNGTVTLWDANDNKVWSSDDASAASAPPPAAAPVAAVAAAPAPANEVVEPWLDVDEMLEAGDWVWSPNKDFKFLLREDGNLVLLRNDSEVWWESKTTGCGATHLTLKSNGELVLLRNGSEVWSLGACAGNKLWVEDNGFVGVYNGDTCKMGIYEEWLKRDEELERGDWLWSNNGEYTLSLTQEGNLVLEDYTGHVYWQTNTRGADRLVMQADGNVVLYNGGSAVWASNTSGRGGVELWLEDDGKVILWDNEDRRVWCHEDPVIEVVEPWLDIGERLEAGDWVWSPNQQFKLLLREDGNLVILHKISEVWWESKTAGHGATHLVLEHNLDLVVYNGGSVVWSLGSGGCGGDKLWVEDNGFVGIYNGDTCKIGLYEEWLKRGEEIEKEDWVWSNNGEYYLKVDDDGDLCLYDYTGRELWSAGCENTDGDHCVMEHDGNLVLYGKNGNAIWSSNTAGRGAVEMWVEDNGKVVLWDDDDREVWST